MTHSDETLGGVRGGGIWNFYAELPASVPHEQIGSALLELDANVQALRQPPVANVEPGVNSEIDDEDARMFYVNFEPNATADDIVDIIRLVSEAIRHFRG